MAHHSAKELIDPAVSACVEAWAEIIGLRNGDTRVAEFRKDVTVALRARVLPLTLLRRIIPSSDFLASPICAGI
jgi:hypothetical protein